jgi:hypothetical protein
MDDSQGWELKPEWETGVGDAWGSLGRPASCVTRTDFGRRAPSAVRSVNNAILRNIATAYFIVPAERNDPDRDPSDEG